MFRSKRLTRREGKHTAGDAEKAGMWFIGIGVLLLAVICLATTNSDDPNNGPSHHHGTAYEIRQLFQLIGEGGVKK